MTSKVAILLLVAVFAAVSPRVDASHLSRTPSNDQPCIVLKISDLRSAYLQRAGVVRYDESNRTPEGLRQQLQHHFDVVLGLLSFATPDSIETAVVRLEAADDHSWSDSERTAWRQKLLAARLVQLQRLAAYRDRGIFPLNEGQSADAAPIFVDRHGTACAVGHLMRCSGWTKDVDSIRESNNLVYVPDAMQSAIDAWVRTSGLTFEEAALIQPAYPWPAQFDASAYEPGELAIEKDGLRYSNFRLQAQNYTVFSPFFMVPTSDGAKPTLAGLGLLTGKGSYNNGAPDYFPHHTPIGTHWIAIAGVNYPALHTLGASAAAGRAQEVVINFDVAVIDTNQRIDGFSESNSTYSEGFHGTDGNFNPAASATYYLEVNAYDGATALGSVYIDKSTSTSDTESFTPKQQISVQADLWLQNGVAMNTFLLDFNVVPEPTSGFLAAVLIATCGLARNREREGKGVTPAYADHIRKEDGAPHPVA